MSEQSDEPDPPQRPSPLRRAAAGLHESADGLGRSWAAARRRLQQWDQRQRRPSFVPDTDTVRIDVRRHWWVLVLPAARTVAALAVLSWGLHLEALLATWALTAVWVLRRLRVKLRRTATVAAGATAAVVVLEALLGAGWTAALLVLWLVEDVVDWVFDRLVVTDKRIYRRYGVAIQHAPSIALTAIAYIDASVPPVGRFWKYGTLSLDSVAQRDAPLSRFDHVPHVEQVAQDILALRTRAMPKFPQQPL